MGFSLNLNNLSRPNLNSAICKQGHPKKNLCTFPLSNIDSRTKKAQQQALSTNNMRGSETPFPSPVVSLPMPSGTLATVSQPMFGVGDVPPLPVVTLPMPVARGAVPEENESRSFETMEVDPVVDSATLFGIFLKALGTGDVLLKLANKAGIKTNSSYKEFPFSIFVKEFIKKESDYVDFCDKFKTRVKVIYNDDVATEINVNEDDFLEIQNFILKVPDYISKNGLEESDITNLKKIRKKLTQTLVARKITKLIEEHKIPFPLLEIKKEEVEKQYCKLEKAANGARNQGCFFDDKEKSYKNFDYHGFDPNDKKNNFAKYRISRLTSHYRQLVDYYNGEVRYSSGSKTKSNLIEAWKDPSIRIRGLMKLFEDTLYKQLKRRLLDKQKMREIFESDFIPFGNFNPIAVISIINLLEGKGDENALKDNGLNTEKGISLLDTSAGWGSRLLAVMADKRVTEYVGFDPNTRLYDGYQKMIDDFAEKPMKSVRVCCKPSEEMTASDFSDSGIPSEFDILLTSPPYWDCEKYSEEETQSWKMYTSLSEWQSSYLHQTLYKGWKLVKKDGFFAINIANYKKNGKEQQICVPMLEFLTKDLGMEYLGCVGYPVGLKHEPFWLLKKTDYTAAEAEPFISWNRSWNTPSDKLFRTVGYSASTDMDIDIPLTLDNKAEASANCSSMPMELNIILTPDDETEVVEFGSVS